MIELNEVSKSGDNPAQILYIISKAVFKTYQNISIYFYLYDYCKLISFSKTLSHNGNCFLYLFM